jgi:hypothetical protein
VVVEVGDVVAVSDVSPQPLSASTVSAAAAAAAAALGLNIAGRVRRDLHVELWHRHPSVAPRGAGGKGYCRNANVPSTTYSAISATPSKYVASPSPVICQSASAVSAIAPM